MHLEARQGPQDRAIEYCRKHCDACFRGKTPCSDDRAVPGTQRTWGSPKQSQQGKRNDIVALRDRVSAGGRLVDLVQDDNLLRVIARYPRLYDTLSYTVGKRRREEDPVDIILLYGKTGCGKTRITKSTFGSDLYVPPVVNDKLWFDGYDGERALLLDDFAGRASKIGLVNLLRMLDRYNVKLPYKGGHVHLTAEVVVITTNVHPWDWYDYSSRASSWEALKRRLVHVYCNNHEVTLPMRDEFFKNMYPASWDVPRPYTDMAEDFFARHKLN